MADVAHQLNGVVQNLPGLENTLELRHLVLVHQVFIQVKPGSGQQWACIVVKVGGNALALFLLHADGCVQQHLLLLLFHQLQAQLVAYHLSLVEDDEQDQANGQYQHSQCSQEEYE